MDASSKSSQKLHAELSRIASLQSEWNALSMHERATIAMASSDLSLFFRRHIGAGVPGATAQIIDLSEPKRHPPAERRPKTRNRAVALQLAEHGDVKRELTSAEITEAVLGVGKKTWARLNALIEGGGATLGLGRRHQGRGGMGFAIVAHRKRPRRPRGNQARLPSHN